MDICVGASKGAAGHDNVTFEGGLVDFVCQVPWSPGKVPSTPAVLRCPSARWIAPFSAGVAPFFPKSYAHLRMATPFTEGVTPFADGLRSFPSDFQGLRRPTPLPRVGGSFAMHVGSARRGDEYGFFCMHYSKLSFLLKMRFCLVYSTSCRPGSAFINRGV